MRRKFIQYFLYCLSALILKKYHPLVIAVSGSVGKTSTKEAIYTLLKNKLRIGKNELNLNTEIGVPLTIIQGKDAKRQVGVWLRNIMHALHLLLWKDSNYPSVLILEMSEDRPGVLKSLVRLTHPTVGVITTLGDPPVHLGNYANKDQLSKELMFLAYNLPKNGVLVSNSDNLELINQMNNISAPMIKVGFNNEADLKITNYKLDNVDDPLKLGCSFRLEYHGSYVPLQLKKVFGKGQVYALAEAAAVGIYFGMNLIEIADQLKNYQIINGRTHFYKGKNDSIILDDSYNACPDSVRNALEIVAAIPASRKIICLGNMEELGYLSNAAHRQISEDIAKVADIFIGVGDKMKATKDTLDNNYSLSDTYWFATSKEALHYLQDIIKKGDLVLIKGSHAMAMDAITRGLRK